MITLNTPVVQEGSFQYASAASDGCLHIDSRTQSGAVIGPTALVRTLEEIDDLCTVFLRNEDTPTPEAHETARRLLSEAQTFGPIYLGASAIEGFDGDLLIHWDTATKSVVLICPAKTNRTPEIYSEVLSGNKAIESKMDRDVSAHDLAKAIAWVLQPL